MRKSSLPLLRGLLNKRTSATPNFIQRLRLASMSTQSSKKVIKENYEVVSPFPDVAANKKDVCTSMLEAARRFSHHTAVECGLTGLSYTYGQLLDGCLRWASHLQTIGITKGDVVAIFMLNGPHYPLVYLGSSAAGATVSCINASFTPNEVRFQVEDSGAKVIIVDPLMEAIVEKALSSSGLANPPAVYVTGSSKFSKVNLLEIIADPNIPFADYKEFAPEDTMCLQYSSGTTGLPKGAIIRHGAIAAHIPMMHHPDIFPNKEATKDSQDVIVGLLPFFHAYGIYVLIVSGIMFGAKIVTLPQFIPDVFMAIHKKNKVEVAHLVPPILQFLVAHPMVKPDDLAFMRVAMCTAAPVPEDAARGLKAKAPNPIFFQEGYGMTETFPTHFTPLTGPEKLGSCGPLMPNVQAKVIDIDTGKALAPGGKGEICIKSPALMHGYHCRPEATAEMYTEDGWMKTGDMATYDEDGYFYIVDRLKELIKVKGSQVSPSELENELLQHPGVADAGVVGVDDARAGELPRAYVVKRKPELTEEEVISYFEERVAPLKQLKGGVVFVNELPKNPAGKLLRKELKQWTYTQK